MGYGLRSRGDGADRAYLDSPKAEWLWEFAETNDIVVHIHPPMLSVGHEVLMQYRLNEAVGRPFDSTVNGARMIGSGLFDRHPKLQVLIVHMGGGLASVLGRLEFNWHLNYNGVRNPPAGRPYTNKPPPSDYFKTNILVDSMGFNPIGLRAAVEMCGVDRVVFGSDYGPIPYGIEEHVQIVEDVLPSPAERQQVFWKTSNTGCACTKPLAFVSRDSCEKITSSSSISPYPCFSKLILRCSPRFAEPSIPLST